MLQKDVRSQQLGAQSGIAGSGKLYSSVNVSMKVSMPVEGKVAESVHEERVIRKESLASNPVQVIQAEGRSRKQSYCCPSGFGSCVRSIGKRASAMASPPKRAAVYTASPKSVFWKKGTAAT
jgi:hypothetical protein